MVRKFQKLFTTSEEHNFKGSESKLHFSENFLIISRSSDFHLMWSTSSMLVIALHLSNSIGSHLTPLDFGGNKMLLQILPDEDSPPTDDHRPISIGESLEVKIHLN